MRPYLIFQVEYNRTTSACTGSLCVCVCVRARALCPPISPSVSLLLGRQQVIHPGIWLYQTCFIMEIISHKIGRAVFYSCQIDIYVTHAHAHTHTHTHTQRERERERELCACIFQDCTMETISETVSREKTLSKRLIFNNHGLINIVSLPDRNTQTHKNNNNDYYHIPCRCLYSNTRELKYK